MHLKHLIIAAIVLLSFPYAFSQATTYSDQDCLICHGKPEISQITRDGKVRPLYVDPDEWSQDIHHLGELTCIDCHTHANPITHFREGLIDVDCARCHPVEEEEYQKNIHLTFTTITPGKELPLCYHCHTKHHILRHDDPRSSVHVSNVGETCGSCHPEVMVKGILSGTSLGKISGHRKGDLSENFDMNVCISCHYEDSAHGAKRVYKDFCTRCHDVGNKGNIVMGPTHLNAARWAKLNFVGNGILILMLFGGGSFFLLRSRKDIRKKILAWRENMRIPIPEAQEPPPPENGAKKDNHESE